MNFTKKLRRITAKNIIFFNIKDETCWTLEELILKLLQRKLNLSKFSLESEETDWRKEWWGKGKTYCCQIPFEKKTKKVVLNNTILF